MANVELKIEKQIAILTMNRPQALNALNADVVNELDAHLEELARMPFSKVRALLITGAGEKAFVAGADIKEIHQLNVESGVQFAHRGQAVFRKIEKLKIPSIAAINGFALGGGLELALSCDFIYASDGARLGLPEVSLGLIPGFGGTVRLARVVGKARAKEMILTGTPLTASQALECGLVNKVLPQAELVSEALKTLEIISTRGPVALSAAKKSVDLTFDLDVDSAMATEAKLFGELFGGKEAFEGTQAFIEKRKPEFRTDG